MSWTVLVGAGVHLMKYSILSKLEVIAFKQANQYRNRI